MDNQERLDDVTPEEWDNIAYTSTPRSSHDVISTFSEDDLNKLSEIANSSISSYGSFVSSVPSTFLQGEMFAVEKKFASITGAINHIADDNLKRMLLTELVEELMNSKYIEFTKQHEPHTGNMVVRARMYVVPDDQVRILRINGIK